MDFLEKIVTFVICEFQLLRLRCTKNLDELSPLLNSEIDRRMPSRKYEDKYDARLLKYRSRALRENDPTYSTKMPKIGLIKQTDKSDGGFCEGGCCC